MELGKLQSLFKDFILDRAAVQFDASPAAGLNIYKKNYLTTIALVVGEKFPKTIEFLKDKSSSLIQQYAFSYPPTEANLDEYGASFDEFLRGQGFSLASELARLDWALSQCLKAKEDASLQPDKVADIKPLDFDRLYLVLSSNIGLVKLSQKAYRIWRELRHPEHHEAIQKTSESSYNWITTSTLRPSCDDGHISNKKKVYLITFPKNASANTLEISDAEYELLYRVRAGESLLAAIEVAIKVNDSFDFRSSLSKLFRRKIFTRYIFAR